jgi:hypothetical protein
MGVLIVDLSTSMRSFYYYKIPLKFINSGSSDVERETLKYRDR